MGQCIYIVDNDESIRELAVYTLESAGFQVFAFQNGREFVEKLESQLPDLVLMDIVLPSESGLTLLKNLRRDPLYKDIPVIFVTSKGGELDKVRALDMGADDYITKPFGVLELTARIRAVLRRCSPEADSGLATYTHKGLTINLGSKQLFKDGEEIHLTYTEYEVLLYLFMNKGSVVSRDTLLSVIWGDSFESESRTVDVHIRSLRQKLADCPESPRFIATIRKYGYMFLSEA